ncbi:MAG: serine hydrolase domain-containing protein [Myxococcota bacterium]
MGRFDPVDWIVPLERPLGLLGRLCPVPSDLGPWTDRAEETPAHEVGLDPTDIDELWRVTRALFRTGLYPGISVCIRRHGQVVLHRALGSARGGGPGEAIDGVRTPMRVDTPVLLYSASKALAAMVIHKLDEQRLVHLDDRVCDYIPEFARHKKHWITIRHILSHSAGIQNLPPGLMDLDLLEDPEHVCELLCDLEPTHGAGRRLAYHAITGGFVLGEIVRRVTGQDMRAVMRKEVCEPLGLRWTNFGVEPADVPRVAQDAVTGLPLIPPLSWLLERALGVPFERVVELTMDPRFLTGVIPAANAVSTADELCRFYQCMLEDGELDGVRIFEPRTIRHATSEQTYLEVDLTLGLPLRYGLGMMLGGRSVGLFGLQTPRAFGHLGYTNIFGWADPDRALSVALLTTGKPVLSLGTARLLEWLYTLGRAMPRL